MIREINTLRIGQLNTRLHQLCRHFHTIPSLQFSQLYTIIRTRKVCRKRCNNSAGLDSFFMGNGNHIGQIILLLRVFTDHIFKAGHQYRTRSHDNASIDFADGSLCVTGITFLNNACDTPIIITNDTAVTCRPDDVHRQHF